MARYNKPTSDGPSSEDKALDLFAEMMIEKIESINKDWKKPWFTEGALQWPKNLNGREYNGLNAFMLLLQCEKQGWKIPRFCTFDCVQRLNNTEKKNANGEALPRVSVLKGERSFPVFITTFTCIDKDTKERIKYDDYKLLSEAERAMYHVYPKLQVYHVFNLDQTNLRESRPEMYQSYLDEAEGRKFESAEGMKDFPALDAMIEKDLYVCPIKPTRGDDAYYSISKDVIVVPEKAQFVDGESFYSNLLHEMGHASGSPSRLDRLKPGQSFGSAAYAREELVAELTAALVSSQYGMEKHVKSDSAAYLKSWLDSLHEDPTFIKSTLLDVKRASSFISQRLDAVNVRLERDGWDADFSDIRKQNKTFTPSFTSKSSQQGTTVTNDQTVKEDEVKSEQTEQVAAKNVNQPRFHR